ncbi:hypothetical protein CW304_30165 [Bacillus sp. UFRGS-B20]|nr:hypothetical protein CW304_30165 [Bacillus sp. UFRGS-B20]
MTEALTSRDCIRNAKRTCAYQTAKPQTAQGNTDARNASILAASERQPAYINIQLGKTRV